MTKFGILYAAALAAGLATGAAALVANPPGPAIDPADLYAPWVSEAPTEASCEDPGCACAHAVVAASLQFEKIHIGTLAPETRAGIDRRRIIERKSAARMPAALFLCRKDPKIVERLPGGPSLPAEDAAIARYVGETPPGGYAYAAFLRRVGVHPRNTATCQREVALALHGIDRLLALGSKEVLRSGPEYRALARAAEGSWGNEAALICLSEQMSGKTDIGTFEEALVSRGAK